MPDSQTILPVFGTVVVIAPIILIALLGLTSLLGRPLSEQWSARAVALVTGIGVCSISIIFVAMLGIGTRHVVVGSAEWVHLDNGPSEPAYHFALKFVFDRLSVPFVALTFILVGTVGAFANRYLHRESGYNRFFVLYSVFLAGMVITALAGTIETLFFGWELVGLSSALLVGFFHERSTPSQNALRVWSVYRISDAALLLAALVLHHQSGGGDFDQLTGFQEMEGREFAAWPEGQASLPDASVWLVGSLLVIAAAGKSALVPFSGWLPRAMEGPTPSSALFYGALSVHLGAYLLLRMDPVLDKSAGLSNLVLALGLITAGFAALTGRVQTDIKSALSFASLTQVGLIVAEIGLGWRIIPLVHLLGHACLRTMQFVRAPSIIREYHTIENAMGRRDTRSGGSSAMLGWLYRFGLERGYLDAVLDRFVVRPIILFFRSFNRLELRVTAMLNSDSKDGPSQ